MEDAKRWLDEHEDAKIAGTARLFGVHPSTLSRQWRGITVSRDEYKRNVSRLLTDAQEKRLVKYINVLTERGNAPSYTMIRRFAAEISKKSVGKNWPSAFVSRNSKTLSSGYLDAIEMTRKKADSVKNYQKWFDQVQNLNPTHYSEVLTQYTSSSAQSRNTAFPLKTYIIWMRRA